MKKKYKILFFLIGLVGVVALALNTDIKGFDWDNIITPYFPYFVVAIFAIWAIIYGLHANTYRLIIGEDAKRIKFRTLYMVCVAGFALNNVTPLGLVGGEPYRIMELKRFLGLEKATSTTLTFSILYFIGHVLLWLTGVAIYICMGCPGEAFLTTLLIIVAVILLGVCYAFFNTKNSGFLKPTLSFFAKIGIFRKKIYKLFASRGDEILDIDQCYIEFRKTPRRFARAICFEYVARLLEGVEYYLIFKYLGEPANIIGGILILSIASLIGNLVFMVPMQVGAREGGMAIALGLLGISPASGLVGGLIYRIRDLICTSIGLICILVEKKEKKLDPGVLEDL